MSDGSNLRNSFFFSGESCSCATAPAAERKSVQTTTRMISCSLRCVKSFHLSHLEEIRREQCEQCDHQQRDRRAVDEEFEFVLESVSFLYGIRLTVINGCRQAERRNLSI